MDNVMSFQVSILPFNFSFSSDSEESCRKIIESKNFPKFLIWFGEITPWKIAKLLPGKRNLCWILMAERSKEITDRPRDRRRILTIDALLFLAQSNVESLDSSTSKKNTVEAYGMKTEFYFISRNLSEYIDLQ